MALFKAVVWALIFLTKLRFPPGVSIAIFDLLPHYITNHTQDGRKYQAYLINELTTDDIHVIDVI